MDNIQLEYMDFLDDEMTLNVYNRKVRTMIHDNDQRLLVDVNDVHKYNTYRAKQLIINYIDEELALKHALKEFVKRIDLSYWNKFDEFFVGFFGGNHVTPRTMKSKFLGTLVCLEGVVSKCTQVQSILVKSVYYCPTTKTVSEHIHTDFMSSSFVFISATSSCVYPTRNDDGVQRLPKSR
ncbi:DNA replication licensing factor MCM3-like [Acyrthosiphon pisum]|uniref:Uncharacterized protein n=1 Tax=Acyrthosiphon pisum TaxID=7029 RepID=A0A8R2FE31_ACYPI|nr:DNA replication licensing factor MCM3-like [Acyrthosiphon pisum]|eukprot:XP_008190212.1 PREDICTED: DNA replication licensing factor MCM3-like [Acyrthosiphon pisum]